MFWQKKKFWVCKSEWVFIQNDKRYLLHINEEIENAWIEYDWVHGATLIYSGKISGASGNMYFMWMEEIQCNLPLWTRLINDIQANQNVFWELKAWACLLTEQVLLKLNNTSWVQCYLCWTHWGLMCVAVWSCMPQDSDEQLNPFLGQRFKAEQCYQRKVWYVLDHCIWSNQRNNSSWPSQACK